MTEVEEAYLDPLMQTEISAVDALAQKGKRSGQSRESADFMDEETNSLRGLVPTASRTGAVESPLDIVGAQGGEPLMLGDYDVNENLLEQELGFF